MGDHAADEDWFASRAAAHRRLCGSAEGSAVAACHAELAELYEKLTRSAIKLRRLEQSRLLTDKLKASPTNGSGGGT
jgi:hypothetical protein